MEEYSQPVGRDEGGTMEREREREGELEREWIRKVV